MTRTAHFAVAALALAAAVGIGRAGSQGDAPAAAPSRPEPTAPYTIEPGDVLGVEVLETLEGRPIKGGYRVRPDGRISLSFYGEVPVAGLTVPQAKERIVQHLRKYLTDVLLGVVPQPGVADVSAPPDQVPAVPESIRDTTKVAVDVLEYNSKKIYVLGRFAAPGKIPATGDETVLDAIQMVGGLADDADMTNLTLVRDGKDGAPARRWSIDLDKVISGVDPSQNHRLRPGDRLIAGRKDRTDATRPLPRPAGPREPSVAELGRRVERIEALVQELAKSLGR